jgi:hypothetical protein
VARQLGEDWNVEVVDSSETAEQQFLLLIGRFSSKKEAAAARDQLRDRLSGPLKVYRRPNQGQQQ